MAFLAAPQLLDPVKQAINGLTSSNFQAQGAPINNPIQPGQIQNVFSQANQGLSQQQQLVNALQAQQGLPNQNSVFAQQQGLANQLQQNALGQGPNPAQAALAQNTSANMAQQAALMAGQRGSSQNAGLIARQVGQQGAQQQQAMTGQAATLQAQQQLAAQQQLGQQQANMANLASQQAGQQIQGQNQYAQNTQGMLGQLYNANQGINAANVQNTGNMNQINAGVAQGNQQARNQVIGGLMNGAAMAFADGGSVGYSQGGPTSMLGQHLHNMKYGGPVPGKATVHGDSSKNDTVPAMLSPGEAVLPRSVMQYPDAGNKAKAFVEALLAKRGKSK